MIVWTRSVFRRKLSFQIYTDQCRHSLYSPPSDALGPKEASHSLPLHRLHLPSSGGESLPKVVSSGQKKNLTRHWVITSCFIQLGNIIIGTFGIVTYKKWGVRRQQTTQSLSLSFSLSLSVCAFVFSFCHLHYVHSLSVAIPYPHVCIQQRMFCIQLCICLSLSGVMCRESEFMHLLFLVFHLVDKTVVHKL